MNKNLFSNDKLIPVIIQEDKTGEVLMLGFMNDKALTKTLESGYVWFWSRKRNMLWKKGETSGNLLNVERILADCDRDTLLIIVTMVGKAVCHKGTKSCFTETLR